MTDNLVSFVATPDMLLFAKRTRELIVSHNRYRELGCTLRPVIPIDINRFADGVSLAKITESIRRTEVYVFYAPPIGNPDLGYAELKKILDAAHFASPQSVKLVLLYFWEGRADRKSDARISTNARTLAMAIEDHHAKGLMTFDLHAEQIQLAFRDTTVDDLKGQVLLAEHCRKTLGWRKKDVGIVAADGGGVPRAEKFAAVSGFPFKGFVYKERYAANSVIAKRYVGDPIDGLHVIMPDDIIDTGGTLCRSGELVLGLGAKDVTACVTHWLGSPAPDPSGDSMLLSAESKFRKAGVRVFALNTIPRSKGYLSGNRDFLTVIPGEPMVARAILESLTPGGSVSKLSR